MYNDGKFAVHMRSGEVEGRGGEASFFLDTYDTYNEAREAQEKALRRYTDGDLKALFYSGYRRISVVKRNEQGKWNKGPYALNEVYTVVLNQEESI